ncbi:response regulator transcription factor [Paracidobacterium acidisoli]|uniref:DNA-binding response regulator n=1 Tax=Paracidobacterium acidisoli TaxID=2303751 RepID=A0A372IK74_9BACT|nr:response regulator transcription factor [Paracidobacterium acidisoli]MBT9333212.1 response regulator transcription factor [Paracidobacterium acidisoli]
MNKVILADSQAIFRAGTAKILAMEDDFRIIAQCAEAERLLPALDAFRCATVLFASTLKLELPDFVERVRAAGSRCIVIAENGESPLPYLSAGVQGFLHRGVSGPALIDCVRRVAAGERNVRAAGIGAVQPPDEDLVGARVRDRLTPKEMKIVALIVQGCKNKEIAMRLGTTEQVIKNYLRSIYDKTGVSDRLELALFTIHHRILAEAAAAVGELMMQGT